MFTVMICTYGVANEIYMLSSKFQALQEIANNLFCFLDSTLFFRFLYPEKGDT